MLTNVVLISYDGSEELMPVTHQSEQLPKFLKLVSLAHQYDRYFEMNPLLRNGTPVYTQTHIPSEPFVQA